VVVGVAVLASVAACAGETRTQGSGPLTERPTATTTAGWPDDCLAQVSEFRDSVEQPAGYPSRELALLAEAPRTGYRLQRVPSEPQQPTSWLIVDEETDEIYAQAWVTHGQRGWVVHEVTRCT